MLTQEKTNENMGFSVEDNKLLFVGLGNIGDKYTNTRHNAGFLFLDYIAKENSLKFSEESKFKALTTSMRFKSEKIILAKPTTLMNRSGQAVKLIQDYYDIPSDNILIAHDDLDIELGEYKIQFAKGPRVHNGVNSVSQSIGTSQYFRVRLGIDNRDSDQKNYMSGKDYVLSKFNKNELDTLKETFVDIYKEILG